MHFKYEVLHNWFKNVANNFFADHQIKQTLYKFLLDSGTFVQLV